MKLDAQSRAVRRPPSACHPLFGMPRYPALELSTTLQIRMLTRPDACPITDSFPPSLQKRLSRFTPRAP